MLDPNQEKFWDNFIKENIAPIETLIRKKHDVAALKLICSAIDILAGFYEGRTGPGHVRESYEKFLKKYMPHFFDFDYSQLSYTNKNLRNLPVNPGSILYHCFRCGSIHDGSLRLGTSFYRDSNIKVLHRVRGIEIMELNITGFWEYFKKALHDYEEDLKKNRQIYDNFVTKYQYINQPVFVLKPSSTKGRPHNR